MAYNLISMDSKGTILKYDIIFLGAAAIWGFAFVAQRMGMRHIGPFTFIAVRFLLGSAFLLLLVFLSARGKRPFKNDAESRRTSFFLECGAAGVLLFFGAALQQHGLVYTTAGKAGFITGLYVIIVPMLGLLWGQRTGTGTWMGAVLAITGLYLLCIKGRFDIDKGDLLVFLGAFFWAGHVLLIGRISRRFEALKVALFQYIVCGVLSLILATAVETADFGQLSEALIPLLYAGIMSTGIAFTLQVVGQRYAHPTHASVLMSTEAVFAVVGGWLILGETMSVQNLAGCALMLGGMILSQIHARKKIKVT